MLNHDFGSFFCVSQSISKDFSKGDGKLQFASEVKLKSMEFQCIMALERSQVYSMQHVLGGLLGANLQSFVQNDVRQVKLSVNDEF